MTARGELKTFVGIQYLRFFAALLVLLDHTFQIIGQAGHGQLPPAFPGGAAGVDVFFVISGFIMTHISRQPGLSARSFLLDRITRVAPPYWLLTLVVAVVLLIKPSVFNSVHLTTPIFLSSIVFMTWPNPWLPGNPPLLQVGWTLNYEMFFYLIFAVSMILSKRYRVAIAIGFITLLALAGTAAPPNNVWIEFYTFPMIVEFAFGMAIAVYTQHRSLSLPLSILIFIAGIILLSASMFAPLGRMSSIRTVLWGFPAALTVLGIVALEQKRPMIQSGALLHLGNASYSLYLTHIFILGICRVGWRYLDAFNIDDAFLLLSCIGGSILAGLAFYSAVERPLIRATRSRLKLNQKMTGIDIRCQQQH